MITEEEIETSWFILQPGQDWSDVSYWTIETTCSSSDLLLKGQGGNVQIRDASESLLKGLVGGKAWLKWVLHVLWKLKPSIFAESEQKWLNLTLLLQSLYCTLKDKEKHRCLKINGPPTSRNHLKVLKQSKAINIITKLYPSSWGSGKYNLVSFATSMFGSVSFPSSVTGLLSLK